MKKSLVILSILLMSQAAQAETIYRASINVGGRIFQDLFVINEMPQFPFQRAALTGSVTVPGIFSAPMTGTMIGSSLWSGQSEAQITLNIEAVERGQKFKVRYEFKTTDLIHIQGSAFLEDGSKLGDFEGERIFKE